MIDVTVATQADAAAVGAVIDAMDIHYRGETARRPASHAVAMVEQTLAEGEGTRFLLARDGGVPVGIACFAIIRPGHALQGLIFLKDLFVVEAARNGGVGLHLLSALARFAVDNKIGRIDLETSPSNLAAQRLYERFAGARELKLQYRWSGDDLRRLADSKPQAGP